ncbi:MAG TPA: SLC13 family permease [Burkholderiales bacterium]|nr:SLC13 family permease [Burkholderiales bacterium]
MRQIVAYIVSALRRNALLSVLLAALVALNLHREVAIARYAALVDWPTIAALAGLLVLTKGIESSQSFDALTRRLVPRFQTERALAFALVTTSALASMLLTNDVTLFAVVPTTMALANSAQVPVGRLVVFEALAVNAGSALTPIGNPQNLFLWQSSGVSFARFTLSMVPLAVVCAIVLACATLLAFRNKPLVTQPRKASAPLHLGLLTVSAVLYVPFLVLADTHRALLGFAAVILAFALLFPRILVQVDWTLIAIFILMFIDLRLVAQLDSVHALLQHLRVASPEHLFLTGIGVSQLLSNVPATIALEPYTQHRWLLAYAVNIGGFGIALGSLANIIALRLCNAQRIWVVFHAYSLPVLAIVAALVYVGLSLSHLWSMQPW